MNAPLSPALSRVARGQLCAGCGACAALAPSAISMQDQGGWLRPVQSAPISAAQETAIARTCPGLGQKVVAGNRQDDALWGPYVSMQTGHATDAEIRFKGSSGGVLSQMLVHLLESGAVDAVIANTADPDRPTANLPLIATDRAGVLAAAGSRYAPSAPLAGIADLDPGKRYAFVGKPCDAAAMRAMTDADPKLAAQVPVILSFFCAGVPSLKGADKVLEALGAPKEDTVAFRYRGNGWPGLATATLKDGTERQMSYHDSWGKILSKHVQHRCKVCADGTGVAADLVCADAWESDEAGYPLFEEQEGTSLIVARSAKGTEILAGAVAQGRVETQGFELRKLVVIQPGQRERRRALLARLLALKLAGRPVPRYQGLLLLAAARQNTMKRNLTNFLGMLRRTLRRPAR